MNKPRNIVLAFATGYTPEQVSVFVESASQAKVDARIIVFCDDRNIKMMDDAFGLKIETRMAWRHSGRNRVEKALNRFILVAILNRLLFKFRKFRYTKQIAEHFILPLLHPTVARYFIYRNWLASQKLSGVNILISDGRDVFFQANPFVNFVENCLYVSEEAQRIENDIQNILWLSACGFTKLEIEAICHFPIVCSGLWGGNGGTVFDYIQMLCTCIIDRAYTLLFTYGLDQPLHNWLVRKEKSELSFNILPFINPVFMHVAVGAEDTLVVNEHGEMINRNGDKVAAVHQYDRHADLAAAVRKKCFC